MKEYLLISRHYTEELRLTRCIRGCEDGACGSDADLIAEVLVRRLAPFTNGEPRKPMKYGLPVRIPYTGLPFSFQHEIKGMYVGQMHRVKVAGGNIQEFNRREATR
jgi:hypothetical protein